MGIISEFLMSTQAILALAVLIAAIVVLVLFRRSAVRERELNGQLAAVQSELKERLRSIDEQSAKLAQQSREEQTANMRGVQDSVTMAMGEMARTQQSQLDLFAGKLSDVNKLGEERMDGIQRTVEQRLIQYQDRMDRVGDVLDDKLGKNDTQLERFRQTLDTRMESLQQDNGKRLEQIERTVDERLNTTLDRRLNESFQLVNERLERVYQGLGEMQSIASGMGDLKRVLTSARARGVVGEMQLSALLGQLMAPEQYRQDVRIKPGGEDVSFAVVLPGRGTNDVESLLPIDAGMPTATYELLMDALESGDKLLADQLSKHLGDAVLEAARHAADQFILPPETTDFAVLFLASEGLYAEALRIGGLAERVQREYQVMLAGPSTLSALLNSLQLGMKTIAIERRSGEVWALLGAVRGEIGNFAEALTRTQKRIRQASESIEDAAAKSRVIHRRLRAVEPVSGSDAKRLLKADDLADDDGMYDAGDWD